MAVTRTKESISIDPLAPTPQIDAQFVKDTFADRFACQAENLKQSQYKIFSANSTSAHLKMNYYVDSCKYTPACGAMGCICGPSLGVHIGSMVAMPVGAVIGGFLGGFIGMFTGIVISVVAVGTYNVIIGHGAHVRAVNDEVASIQKKIVAIENKEAVHDPLQDARTELEAFAKNSRISKKDLVARIEIYDNETKITLIKSILQDNKKTTILGERFWRKEGFFACSPSAGTLCELGTLLRKLEEVNNSHDVKRGSPQPC